MAAHESLSNQFVTLYRGMTEHPDDVNYSRLGEHWTTDLGVAKDFATPLSFKGAHDPSKGHGTIFQATVHPSEIIQPNTEEWKQRGGGDYESGVGIYDYSHHEQERTLRWQSRVEMDRVMHFHKGIQINEFHDKEGTV